MQDRLDYTACARNHFEISGRVLFELDVDILACLCFIPILIRSSFMQSFISISPSASVPGGESPLQTGPTPRTRAQRRRAAPAVKSGEARGHHAILTQGDYRVFHFFPATIMAAACRHPTWFPHSFFLDSFFCLSLFFFCVLSLLTLILLYVSLLLNFSFLTFLTRSSI